MRIYTDITHPACAHALRFFIGEMESRGHEVLISARDKDITHCLLKAWGTGFIDRGRGSSAGGALPPQQQSIPGRLLILSDKVLGLAASVKKLFPLVKKFGPDIVVSWSSYHAALIGRLLGKPVITFEDTENVPLLHTVNRFLSTIMVTPSCFERDLGPRHIRFKGYKELASLHPSRFDLQGELLLEQPYILLRFVSGGAYHDIGRMGLSEKMKHVIAERLSVLCRVYISSEDEPAPGLYRYRLPVECHMMHRVIAGASLLFGESASMAAEAAVLGVPAIFIDNAGRGYTRELEREYGLMFSFGEDEESVLRAVEKARTLLRTEGLQAEWQKKRMKMLREKIDVTAWMADLAEDISRGNIPGRE